MHPLAQAAASSAETSVGPAVLVVVAVAGIWMYALGRKGSKGTIPGRLSAVIVFAIAVWVLVAVHSPAEGARIASGAASGISVALGAFGRVIGGI